jgi:hypothetical protein
VRWAGTKWARLDVQAALGNARLTDDPHGAMPWEGDESMRQWWLGLMVGGLVGGLTATLVVLLLVPPTSRAAPEDQVQQVIRAQRFELRDPNGSLRGALDVSDEGAAYFVLLNQEGRAGVEVTARRRASQIALGGPDTSMDITLRVDERTPGEGPLAVVRAGRQAGGLSAGLGADQNGAGVAVYSHPVDRAFIAYDSADPSRPTVIWSAP